MSTAVPLVNAGIYSLLAEQFVSRDCVAQQAAIADISKVVSLVIGVLAVSTPDGGSLPQFHPY
jgi:hypothetical protein